MFPSNYAFVKLSENGFDHENSGMLTGKVISVLYVPSGHTSLFARMAVCKVGCVLSECHGEAPEIPLWVENEAESKPYYVLL